MLTSVGSPPEDSNCYARLSVLQLTQPELKVVLKRLPNMPAIPATTTTHLSLLSFLLAKVASQRQLSVEGAKFFVPLKPIPNMEPISFSMTSMSP